MSCRVKETIVAAGAPDRIGYAAPRRRIAPKEWRYVNYRKTVFHRASVPQIPVRMLA